MTTTTGFLSPKNGSALAQLLIMADIQPGATVSYELAKLIYTFHPLGAKMAEAPLNIAFSQEREVSGVPELVKKAFVKAWKRHRAKQAIYDTMRQARIYGIASCVEVEPGFYSVFDPLITSGSLTLNQNAGDRDFLKAGKLVVGNREYGPRDSVVIMNELPIYLAWTESAYGYSGRSVYQRALYPLQTFVQSMITDNLVTQKAGVLISKTVNPGSAIDGIMEKLAGYKRNLLKESKTYNVINIGEKESVETLDLTNTATAMKEARNNVLDNIAAACDMPAILLKSEILNQGFGEGTEDAKTIANYVNRIREELEPLYDFFIPRVQKLAWTEDFYNAVIYHYPEYAGMGYRAAVLQWTQDFDYSWPNLLTEPDSEKSSAGKARVDSILAMYEALVSGSTPENILKLKQWLVDSINAEVNKTVFPEGLLLDLDTPEGASDGLLLATPQSTNL